MISGREEDSDLPLAAVIAEKIVVLTNSVGPNLKPNTIVLMGILGIGVDIVHVPRITSLISRRGAPRLVSRILSVSEISDWNASPPANQNRFLAVRWAAKEAAYKALYPAVKPTWKQLTYRGLQVSAKPTLEYHPIAEDALNNVGKLHVSISHDEAYVFASVVVENSY